MPSASTSATRQPLPPDSLLRTIWDAALAVLLAPPCAACQVALAAPSRGPVCPDCWRRIAHFTPPLCGRCGDPILSWRTLSLSAALCPRCRRRPSALTACRAIGPYEGSLRAIVQAMKYQGCRSLAAGLAARMRSAAVDILEGADGVVPVPLHRARRRARGFNQAADLARGLNLPVIAALKRTRATPSQTGLPAARRHANIRGAFALRHGCDVRGMRIVLVDDVSTTGATLEACARVLMEGGASSVSALTAARVVTLRRG